MNRSAVFPTFYLYGEPHRSIDEAFVHIEILDDRSRPSEWTIREHRHTELNHIFHIASGGGTLRSTGVEVRFLAPALLMVPAGIAHGFEWQSESTGVVITVATAYLQSLYWRDDDLPALFLEVTLVPLEARDAEAVRISSVELMREYGSAKPGQRAAIGAGLTALLVRALRRHPEGITASTPPPVAQADLVGRLRQRIDARFRLREPIAQHAHALNVSLYQLRAACARVARLSPLEMLDQRAMLEARRALLYSKLSIAEIAFSLGFSDAAYFSRFFHRHAGCSPRAYRLRQVR